METVLIYMTASTKDEAQRIAQALVEERLVACVNILAPMTSVFRWDGQVQFEKEISFLAKTRDDLVEKVVACVRRLHSYDVPCVVAVPITGGDSDFQSWIAQETGPSATDRHPT